jgi:hypothetical protein
VKVRSALGTSELDKQLGGFDIAALHRHSLIDRPDNREQLAADFPGIMASAPGVRVSRARERGAEIVDEGPGHVCFL